MKYKIAILLLFCIARSANAQNQDSIFARANYDKFEYRISMRDGISLFAVAYVPKDKSQKYPIMLNRTCYNASNYGEFKNFGPSKYMMREKYIFVYEDVRGRYMSEGTFDNMRPHVPNKKSKKDIDESSDTFDTIEWLIKNISGNNGKVGMWGISYPGFYAAAAIPEAHPALKASSPQAPIADFFFDDFHHQGVFLQSYLAAYPVFGYQKDSLTRKAWYNDKLIKSSSQDGYDFNLAIGPLKNVDKYYGKDNFFWQQTVEHPNYDEFWQIRSILPHLKNVKHAVMTVGGWFDAEDLYGPLSIYKTLEKNNAGIQNTIVMGPWSHGDWARERGTQTINHIYFGDSISTFYQKEIEFNFFKSILKDNSPPPVPEAYMYDTGVKTWNKFDVWPPKNVPPAKLYFHENGKLSINNPGKPETVFEYISDPAKPVPYTSETEGVVFTPRRFMTDDQRQASKRPDVITFQTDPLVDPVTLAGEILAKLKIATTGTDADFIVKLIDVYPDDHASFKNTPAHIKMGGYQQLVRSEVFRSRFRNSYEKPEPLTAEKITDVNVPLQDMLHTFKKGHRVMIQIHSSWFPYIDRNPQKYVENIYKANEADFIKATIRVYGSSVIEVGKPKEMEGKIDTKK